MNSPYLICQDNSIKVNLIDGSTKSFDLNEIQNITISKNSINTILNIYYQKSSSERFITSIIDTIKFEVNDKDELELKVFTSEKIKSYIVSEIDSIITTMMPTTYMPLELIPSGSFQMGNTGHFPGDTTEFPVHKVTISKPFYMGKFEVTQAQWEAVMGEHVFYYIGDNLPAHVFCWNQVIEFCNRLSDIDGLERCYKINMNGAKDLKDKRVTVDFEKTKNGWRLPTEAEWEYACKAGTTTDYYTGHLLVDKECSVLDINLDKAAWYCTNDDFYHPISVGGRKQPNNFGLYDMLGNVYELTFGWWTWKYSPDEVIDPIGPPTGVYISARGGSSFTYAMKCRTASRELQTPYYEYNLTGFRVCRNY